MRNIEAINANIARNIAFWRQTQGLTLQAATQGTEIRPETLEAIEKRKEVPLAAHLFQLATVWAVPSSLLTLDFGEAFYRAAERSELWHEVWCALLDVEEQGALEKALANVIALRDAAAVG